MNALGALFYADRRAFANDWRRIVRSPARLALWAVYVAAAGFFFWSRTSGRARLGAHHSHADLARADFFMCALLVALALALAGGRGAIGIFRSRAEARFIIGSPLAAPLAIAYLQAREALAQGARLLFSLCYFIFVFGPRHLPPLVVVSDVLLVLAVVTAAAAVVVPRRLASRPAGVVCLLVGVPLALLAAAPALRDAVRLAPFSLPAPLTGRVLALIPAWHPGRVLFEASPLPLLAALALAAAAIAVLAAAGRDAYPELYALSIARIDRFERLRRRAQGVSAARKARRRRVQPIVPAPPGVLVFVWKSVVEFQRQTQVSYVLGGAAVWCGAGFAAARFTAAGNAALFATLIGVIVNLMLFVGLTAANAISSEVRRPLFWLARAALFERLCALALARVWRTIVSLELIALGFALGGGKLTATLVFAGGLPALATLLTGVGFAAFALFPSAADARGPVAILRLGVSVVLLVPPFVLYAVAAVGFGAALGGLGAATLLALIEGGALIGIAAWRLDGRVDRLPA